MCNAHLALARLLLTEASRRQTVRHHLCVPGRFPKCSSCFRTMIGVWLLVASLVVGAGVLVASLLAVL